MMNYLMIFIIFISFCFGETPTVEEILTKIDNNLVFNKALTNSTMTIHSKSRSRTIKSRSWGKGSDLALVEYLYPPREKGKKMLKTKNKIWIYTPEPTDRIITISGHMLRQSVMGSDLSYEDITDNTSMLENYTAKLLEDEKYLDRDCWVLELAAKKKDIVYHSRKIWVDKERFLPLKEERFAKSGRLLKTTKIPEVFFQDSRWLPKKMIFKDVLSKGKGTEYIINSIDFDVKMPEYYFTKAGLKR